MLKLWREHKWMDIACMMRNMRVIIHVMYEGQDIDTH